MAFDNDLHVLTPLILVGPWLLGALLGWRLQAGQRGLAVAVLLGLLLTAAALAAFVLAAASTAADGCGETACMEILGRRLDLSLVREWPLYAMAGWLGGVAIVSYVREKRANLPENAR